MKTLKILLGNNTLSLLAGTETWTYTLALALKELGHDVSCFSPELGIISQKLAEKGIKSFNTIDKQEGIQLFTPFFTEPVSHQYDVIIANHFHIVAYLREKFPKTPIINTVHGPIHSLPDGTWAPEHPATESGVSQFVATCGQQADRMRQEYGIDAKVINNFFDIPTLSALRPAREKPEQFLFNTNYLGRDDEPVKVVREVARHFGVRMAAIGANFAPTPDITKAIEESDVVFGMGRSVMEGVAAGRLGIVQGRWGTGGPIIESTVDAIRYHNFSGRNSEGVFATKEELIAMIEQYYNPAVLEWGKKYAAREHNSISVAEEYVRIAYDLTGESINAPRPTGVDPIAKPLKKAF